MLPGWYGTGQALSAFKDRGLLREMAATWPFFQSTLDNLEMVLAKSDMSIARRYSTLVEDRALAESLFSRIETAWNTTHDTLLDITGRPGCWKSTRRWMPRSGCASPTSSR